MAKEKRKPSVKLIQDLEEYKAKYDFLRTKETDAFINLVKKNADLMDTKLGSNFLEMVKTRQATKYYDVSQAEFEAMMKKQYEEQLAIFQRSKYLTRADKERSDEMKEKTIKTRLENKRKKEQAQKEQENK